MVEEPRAVHAHVNVPSEQCDDAVGHYHLKADQFPFEVFMEPWAMHLNQPVNAVEENKQAFSVREFLQAKEFLV